MSPRPAIQKGKSNDHLHHSPAKGHGAMRSHDTNYRGQRFRSRLEARWAAFFDLIGWRWEYEPFDADGYIPDFAVPGRSPLLVEVKPEVDLPGLGVYTERLHSALVGHWGGDVLIVGATLFPHGHDNWGDEVEQCAGVLGEYFDTDCPEGNDPWDWEPGIWTGCQCPYSAGVMHSLQSFAARPCGFYDGDNFLPRAPDLEDRWRAAGAAVRWERPA